MKQRLNSRRKGKAGELELATLLRGRGFDGARRGRQFKGAPDSPDVIGIPGWHIEAKRCEKFNLYRAYAQACHDAGDQTPIVIHRSNSRKWMAVLALDDFLALLSDVRATAALLDARRMDAAPQVRATR